MCMQSITASKIAQDTVYRYILRRRLVPKCSQDTVNTTRIRPLFQQLLDCPQFVYNKIFLKMLSKQLIVNIFTLLLVSFVSKLVNYSRRSESEHSKEFEIGDIFFRKRRFVDVQAFFKNSMCLYNWPIWTQKVPKEA